MQVNAQNRVAQALALLPSQVQLQGVTTKKRSPSILLAVSLISPDGRFDDLYLSNYATIRLRDEFGHLRLRQSKYTPGQIDRKWSDDIEKDFTEWLKGKGQDLTPYQREKLLKGRTW